MKHLRRSHLGREHFYRDLVIGIAAIILAGSLLRERLGGALFDNLLVAMILTVALVEVARTRRRLVVGAILGLPAIASRFANLASPGNLTVDGAVLALTVAFFAFLIWLILHDLFSERRTTGERIYGAIAAYFFIGLLFALLYAYIRLIDPDSFAASASIVSSESRGPLSLFTYFSFVTLTTLGYGDITPASEATRALAWFEALVGQLYLAVMIAGLVAIHITETGRRRGEPAPPSRGQDDSDSDCGDQPDD